ncbi:FAD-dependent monooxygenase [Streptomyces sp. NPDC050743]|uniref:FAD-dependent monooxygenase n=1 Tax=Streptomyces sp. NPDC050743 TaxID=3365634 RepID=UPI0037B14E07
MGAGPVGLWLAHELGLAGVSVLVLERDTQRSPHSKALGIHPRTVEVLAMRGRHRDIKAAGRPLPSWHFGMLESRVDLGGLDTPFPYLLAYPQAATEALLEQYATDVGAVVRRGHTVTNAVPGPFAVTLEVSGPDGDHVLRPDYVVGCDGAGSTVRRAAGIPFPGTDATAYGFLGEVVLDTPPAPGFAAHTAGGHLIVVPLGGDMYRVTGYDPLNQDAHQGPLTMEELRETTQRLAGTDFGMHHPVWLSRFGNATRVASAYRHGRILLAGDAAHMHFPAGGVGLNVGIQDAMNLGWKLAAVVQKRAHPDLLDSYHGERHPVGLDLAENALAQTALITGLGPEVRALRRFLSKAVDAAPDFSRLIARTLSALDVAYRPASPDAHALVGTRAHDAEGEGILPLLHDGRPVLLTDAEGTLAPEVRAQAAQRGIAVHASRLPLTGGAQWSGVTAAVLRPDGHVWWATEQRPEGAGFGGMVCTALQRLPATF